MAALKPAETPRTDTRRRIRTRPHACYQIGDVKYLADERGIIDGVDADHAGELVKQGASIIS